MNKNIDETEVQKLTIQEENALRLLSTTASTSRLNINTIIFFFIPFLIFFVCYITIFVLTCIVPKSIYNSIQYTTPCLKNAITLVGYQGACLNYGFRYAADYSPLYISQHPDSPLAVGKQLSAYVTGYHSFIRTVWFGEEGISEGLRVIGDLHGVMSSSSCDTDNFMLDEMGILSCGSLETTSSLIFQLFTRFFQSKTKDPPAVLDATLVNDLTLSYALYWAEVIGFEKGLTQVFDLALETLQNKQTQLTNNLIIPAVVLLIVIILAAFFSISGIDKIGSDAVWSIRLLLFCQQQTILNSKVILKIILGNQT